MQTGGITFSDFVDVVVDAYQLPVKEEQVIPMSLFVPYLLTHVSRCNRTRTPVLPR